MADDLICPKCGKIDTSRDDLHLKVSSVHASGQATGAYRDWEGYRSYDHIQSQLSSRLGPPQATHRLALIVSPKISGPTIAWNWKLVLFLGIVLAIGFLVNLRNMTPDSLKGFIILGFGLLLFAILAPISFHRRSKILEERGNRAAKQKALYNQWNNLYYCKRHDIVFDPDTSFNLPSDQLQNYWRESANKDGWIRVACSKQPASSRLPE